MCQRFTYFNVREYSRIHIKCIFDFHMPWSTPASQRCSPTFSNYSPRICPPAPPTAWRTSSATPPTSSSLPCGRVLGYLHTCHLPPGVSQASGQPLVATVEDRPPDGAAYRALLHVHREVRRRRDRLVSLYSIYVWVSSSKL